MKLTIQSIVKNWAILFSLMSIFSYLFDCIVNFEYAIENMQYLFAYFIQYAVFRSWLFLIVIILYFFIFQKFSERKYIVFKIFFAVLASGLYAKYFYMDDYSLTIGSFKKLKLFYTCLLSSIPLISVSEWHRKS